MRTSRYPTLEEDHEFRISVSLKESDTTFEVSHAELSVVQDIKVEIGIVVSKVTFNQRE